MNSIKKFRIIKFKSRPVLSAKNISKSFGKRVVLRKIDIHLNKGEMLGLLGSNGTGKSTFMNIVLGLLKPDYGDIFLDKTKLTTLPIHERSKIGIGYLPRFQIHTHWILHNGISGNDGSLYLREHFSMGKFFPV